MFTFVFVCDVCVCVVFLVAFVLSGFRRAKQQQGWQRNHTVPAEQRSSKESSKEERQEREGESEQERQEREGERQYVCPYVNSCVTCDVLFALSFFK